MGFLPFSKLKKRVITWTSIFIVLVLVFLGILKLGLYFSSDILFELVKRETNGYYLLSFEEMDIDLWNRAIKLKQVMLKPDSTKDFQTKGLTNLYDFELSGLHIDLESITSIYMERRLLIENVRIIDPQIHIIREKNAPDESFSLQTGNLYKEISDYLKVLRIDFFTIENAEFEHSSSELGLDNIDFLVSNLLIDSASRHDQNFYSENIELEIRNQGFKLGDSIHQLSFDRFLLSTADSVLTFENLVLKPVTAFHGAFDDLDDKIVYDITIPQLKLKGVDYFSAYRNNHLEMEELALTDSHIFLEEQTHNRMDQREKKGNSLLKQLIKIFDEVKIGKMRLINTNLNLKTNDDYNHNYQHVQSERADIVLYNFFLDSGNYHFGHGKKYFDDVDIIIKDYSSYLPDSIHTIDFDLLQLSSFDSSLVFKNFSLSNNGNRSGSDMLLSIDLPLISLKGLNYLDILIHQKLSINEVLLQNPNLTFEKSHRMLGKLDFSPDKVYSGIAGHFKVVGIKKLLLQQGAFSINQRLNFRQTDLLISNFSIHDKSNSWYDVLGGVDLEMQDMALHDETINMTASHLKLDRIASRLTLDELSIDILDQNKSASGDLSSLIVTGIDLDSISAGNYLAFDSIRLNNPQVKVDLLKPGQGGPKSNILGNKYIEIVNGQVDVKAYNATAFSFNKINTTMALGAVNYIYAGEARQISYTSPTSGQKLNIDQLTLTESGQLSTKNIELRSIKDTTLHKVELNGNIPAFTIYGLDQNAFWRHNKLVGDSLIIETPNLDLNLNDITTSSVSAHAFDLQFQKIMLHEAHLAFSDKGQADIQRIETPHLSVTLEAFHYPHKSVLGDDHLLYADDATLNIKNLRPIMANGDSAFIRQLNFNKKDALILIDTLSFDQPGGATSVLLPGIKIVGLDLHAFVSDQQLKLDSIRMVKPQIAIDHRASKLHKQRSIKTTLESVDVKYFSSVETEIELRDSLNPAGYAVHQGKFEVQEFHAQGEIVWERFFNYSQLVSMSGKNLSAPLGDGYQLSIDQYDLQHPKNVLTLNNINLVSDFTAAEYSSNLAFQKDWFDISVDGIAFSGLDFEKSFGEREYHADKILLEGLDALVYRDKSVPFQSSMVKELPQSILRNIDAWFNLDTLQIKGDITYQEKPANKEEIAEISFNSLEASLFHITSVDSMAHKPMHFVSKGQLADTANFEIIALFDMFDRSEPRDKFTFSGHIDQMPLGALNKMLRPVAGINIKDGFAERVSFNIEANNELARGEMNIRYSNLKVQILNPETNDLKGLNQGIKTFFANTFVVKRKNPNFIFLRPGKIFQPRDSSRAIFHYWGKALLSGAVSSVGINKIKKAEKRYARDDGQQKR